MSVMINNIIDAMPQAGISRADVVYEAPVEGEITRLLAIFEDYADLEKIGPVRSCRDYFIDFAMEFDAIYTHYGQAVYAYDLLNSDMLNNISGLQYQDGVGEIYGYAGEDIFYRTDDRPAPHNAYTSYSGLMTAVERNGYSMQYADDYSGHFLFAEDGERVSLHRRHSCLHPSGAFTAIIRTLSMTPRAGFTCASSTAISRSTS